MKALFFIFLSLSSFAADKEWVCHYSIHPHNGGYFKGCHANKTQAIRNAKKSCVSYVNRMGYKWGSSEEDCYFKSCRQDLCEHPPDPRDPSNPFCNYQSECGEGRVCSGGICRDKDDRLNNNCSQDSDCGMDGKCHPFGYCE